MFVVFLRRPITFIFLIKKISLFETIIQEMSDFYFANFPKLD